MWSVCLCLVTRMCCANAVETIEMPFGDRLISVRGDHVLDGGQDLTNLFAAARGDESAMRPLPNYSGHLLLLLLLLLLLVLLLQAVTPLCGGIACTRPLARPSS